MLRRFLSTSCSPTRKPSSSSSSLPILFTFTNYKNQQVRFSSSSSYHGKKKSDSSSFIKETELVDESDEGNSSYILRQKLNDDEMMMSNDENYNYNDDDDNSFDVTDKSRLLSRQQRDGEKQEAINSEENNNAVSHQHVSSSSDQQQQNSTNSSNLRQLDNINNTTIATPTTPLLIEAVLQAFEEEYPNLPDNESSLVNDVGFSSSSSEEDSPSSFIVEDGYHHGDDQHQLLNKKPPTNPFLARLGINPLDCTIHGDRVIAIPFRPRSSSDLELAAEVVGKILVVSKAISEDMKDDTMMTQTAKKKGKPETDFWKFVRPKYLFDFEMVHDLNAPSSDLVGPYLVAAEMSQNIGTNKILTTAGAERVYLYHREEADKNEKEDDDVEVVEKSKKKNAPTIRKGKKNGEDSNNSNDTTESNKIMSVDDDDSEAENNADSNKKDKHDQQLQHPQITRRSNNKYTRTTVRELCVKAVIRNSTTGSREATGVLTYHL